MIALMLLLPLCTRAAGEDRASLVGTWKIVQFQDDGSDRLIYDG